MCVIILCKTGRRPQKSVLETSAKNNPDGIGFAAFVDGGVYFEKGIKMERLLELMDEHKGPCAIHFRKTTSGGTNNKLCHPFPIHEDVPLDLKGTVDSVLFHNGTFKEWMEHLRIAALSLDDFTVPPDMWSDSRAIAKFVYHKGDHFLNLLSYDNTNRFLIMDGRDQTWSRFGGWFKYPYETTTGEKVLVDGKDTFDEEIVFSNDYWDGSKKK